MINLTSLAFFYTSVGLQRLASSYYVASSVKSEDPQARSWLIHQFYEYDFHDFRHQLYSISTGSNVLRDAVR